MSRARILLLGLLLVGVSACNNSSMYSMQTAHAEHLLDKVDSQWWTRRITDANGKLDAIELIYCPIQDKTPVVCRTAIIWEAEKTLLNPATSTGQ